MCRSGDCIVRLVVSSLETSKYKRKVENLHKISGHISLGRFHLNISSTIDAILRPPNFQSVNRPSVLIGRFVKSREKTLYEHLAACLLFRTPKIPCAMFIFFLHDACPFSPPSLVPSFLVPFFTLRLSWLSFFPFLPSFSFSFFPFSFPFFSVTLADLQQLHHTVRCWSIVSAWEALRFPCHHSRFCLGWILHGQLLWAQKQLGCYRTHLVTHHASCLTGDDWLVLLLSSTFLSFCFKLFNFALSFSWDTIYCWIVLPKKTTTVPFSSCFCIFRVCYLPFCTDFSQEAEHALCEVVVVSVSILGLRNFCTRLCATI